MSHKLVENLLYRSLFYWILLYLQYFLVLNKKSKQFPNLLIINKFNSLKQRILLNNYNFSELFLQYILNSFRLLLSINKIDNIFKQNTSKILILKIKVRPNFIIFNKRKKLCNIKCLENKLNLLHLDPLTILIML